MRETGHPISVDPERFHLISQFETDPQKWLRMPWTDQHSGKRYRVSTARMQNPKVAMLKTYGDVLEEYEHHPEHKCAASDGAHPGGEPSGC